MRKKINPEETVSISFEFILTIQHIFLFYSLKDSTADFSFTPSVCCADSPLSEGAFLLLRAKQASLPEGGGIAKQ